MYFNFKEALQDTRTKLKETYSLESVVTQYLKDFNEELLKSTKDIFKDITKIHFAIIKEKCLEYRLNVFYTNSKGEIKFFNFDMRRWYKDQESASQAFNALKEKIKKDGFEICKSDVSATDGETLEDSFSIEIK